MSTADLPEPTIDQARHLGEKGSPARESERLLFEAWMGGHCWAIGGVWNGKQYKASDEDGSRVNQQAMLTRMLWAAWRDRGTLAADQLRAYGDKRAREAVDDGYASAFYELAGLLGMTAQALPPAQVWRDQMLPQIKAALRDAERYRWLRAPARGEACGAEPYVGIDSPAHPNCWALFDDEADAAVDAAMAASPSPDMLEKR